MSSSSNGSMVMSKETVIIVGASGQVGTGIVEAFALNNWNVIAIDPRSPCHSTPTAGGSVVHRVRKTAENIDDADWQSWFVDSNCCELCYTAEEGNRDVYSLNAKLGDENCRRFTAFLDRLRALWEQWIGDDAKKLNISYVGGSWTRRKVDTETFVVQDGSPVKVGGGANPYERSKTEAYENALELSKCHHHWCRIAFLDYISVVPNYAPNFTMGKMVKSALENGRIVYSEGDFGRPLLHRRQAGEILVALANNKMKRDYITTILVPGHFIPFKTFALIAKEVVQQHKGGSVQLDVQENTPDFLRSSCVSDKLKKEIGFVPDGALVELGLRDTAEKALGDWVDGSSSN